MITGIKCCKGCVAPKRYPGCHSNCPEYLMEKKQCLRHEIIHAFMFESGLGANWEHKPIGHEETTVDWIAAQFPKLLEVFEKVGALK